MTSYDDNNDDGNNDDMILVYLNIRGNMTRTMTEKNA